MQIINRASDGHLLDTVTLHTPGLLRYSAALSVALAWGSAQPIRPHQVVLRTFWVNSPMTPTLKRRGDSPDHSACRPGTSKLTSK